MQADFCEGNNLQNRSLDESYFLPVSAPVLSGDEQGDLLLKKNVNRATGGHNERSTQSFPRRLRSIQQLTNNRGHSMALQVARVLGITESSD